MRGYSKSISVFAAAVAAVLFFSLTTAFAAVQNIKGVEFTDGVVVYGKVVKMTAEEIQIDSGDGALVTRKFADVERLIKDDDRPEVKRQRHFFTVGTEVSYIKYKEPDVMQEDGMMVGLVGSYAYRNQVMLKAEGKIAYGVIEYDGRTMGGTPLSISNIPNYALEGRGLVGYDFVVGIATITPYVGLGYRWLQDNPQRKYPGGYQRESNYFYSPLGVDTVFDLGKGWFAAANLEYDAFIWGKQKSRFSDIDPGYNDLENRQHNGFGIRGGVSFGFKGARAGFVVEPYVRYWKIEESDVAWLTYYGSFTGDGFVEPKNKSTEVGCRVAVTF